jgi:hypothetical protein
MCPYCNHHGLEPAHNNYSVGVNLPEDYLPTRGQWPHLSEMLERNWTNNFGGKIDVVLAHPPKNSKRNWCDRVGEEETDDAVVNPNEANAFVIPFFDNPGGEQTYAVQTGDEAPVNMDKHGNILPTYSAADEDFTMQNASEAVFTDGHVHQSTAEDSTSSTGFDKGKTPVRNNSPVITPPINGRATIGGRLRSAASMDRGQGPVRTQTGLNYGPYVRTPRQSTTPPDGGQNRGLLHGRNTSQSQTSQLVTTPARPATPSTTINQAMAMNRQLADVSRILAPFSQNASNASWGSDAGVQAGLNDPAAGDIALPTMSDALQAPSNGNNLVPAQTSFKDGNIGTDSSLGFEPQGAEVGGANGNVDNSFDFDPHEPEFDNSGDSGTM